MEPLKCLKLSCVITLLITSTSMNAALKCPDSKPCTCPDMNHFTGEVPEGWHVRFNEKIKPSHSNHLQVIIMEMVDKKNKNNFYCRYTNHDGDTFVLSTSLPAAKMKPENKTFWHYDSVDDLWECHPQSHKHKIGPEAAQCVFAIK